MTQSISMYEILEVLKGFANDQDPRTWTINFFLAFFDLLGLDMLKVVNESHIRGKVVGALNATFIAMIPKGDQPKTFNDYRPISLCNLVYKIITKKLLLFRLSQ